MLWWVSQALGQWLKVLLLSLCSMPDAHAVQRSMEWVSCASEGPWQSAAELGLGQRGCAGQRLGHTRRLEQLVHCRGSARGSAPLALGEREAVWPRV